MLGLLVGLRVCVLDIVDVFVILGVAVIDCEALWVSLQDWLDVIVCVCEALCVTLGLCVFVTLGV